MSDKVDPGEGYRLLEGGEIIRGGDEFFQDGEWKPYFYAVGAFVGKNDQRTRRKLDSGGWIKISEQAPKFPAWLGNQYGYWLEWTGPLVCQTNATHWQAAILPNPLPPEKSEAELAYEKWQESGGASKWTRLSEVWLAAWEASRKAQK